jgi:hypothetical protein
MPYAPAPSADDPTAVMGRRVGAWLLDGVIVLAPSVALASRDFEFIRFDDFDAATDFCDDLTDASADAVCVPVPGVDRAYFAEDIPEGGVIGGWVLALGLGILIYVLLQGLRGWTPGKLLFGLRTVGEDGEPPGIGKAIVRWLLFIVDGLLAGLVGFIVALTSTGHRRVGDMAARTYVVGRQHAGRPVVLPGATPPAYAGRPSPPGYARAPGGGGARDTGGWGPPPGDQPPTWGQAPTWPPPADRPSTEPPEGRAPWPEPTPTAPAPREPEPEPSGAAETGDTAAAAPSDYNPQWDPARGTYIVWSPERGQWLGWDDAAQEWKPL